MKKLFLVCLWLMLSFTSISQIYTYNNIKRVRLNNINTIVENKKVIGYYVFYYKEKASSKESVYELSILDANLSQTHSIELIKPKNLYLLEGSFNGNVFCFSFLSLKNKTLEYQIIDKKAKVVGSYMVEDLSKSEIQTFAMALQDEEDTYSGGLIAVEGKGFVRYGIEKKGGMRYEIEMIDNNAKKIWTATSESTAKKSYETTQAFYADATTVVTLVCLREKMMSTSEMDYHLLFTNPENGKEQFKVSTETDKAYLVPMGINYDASSSQFLVYGEYYGKKGSKERFDAENKLGFFMFAIDKSGKTTEQHYVDWKSDIASLIPLNSKGRMEGNYSVFIHNLVKTADGKYFIIGEQFKKTASALGIAGAVAGGSNVSTVKINLQDIVVFEFNNSFKPQKVYIVEKDEAKILLPKGAGYMGTNTLGLYLKQNSWFDYSFTYVSSDNKNFTSTYVNYDKEKGESKKYVIGNIGYKNGEIKTDKIPLTSKPTYFSVMPGKSGYVVIFEYFRKEKKASIRLEKLDM